MNTVDADSERTSGPADPRSRGGRAAAGGQRFEHQLAAFHLTLLLAGELAPPPASASGNVASVWLQAHLPVDDIVVTTSDGGGVYIQAKSQLPLSFRKDSPLAGSIGAFAALYLEAGMTSKIEIPDQPWRRTIDPARDRLVIAIGPMARGRAERAINALAAAAASGTYSDLLEVINTQREMREAFEGIRSLIADAPPAGTADGSRSAMSPEKVQTFLRCLRVEWYDFRDTGWSRREAIRLLRGSILSDPGAADDAWTALVDAAADLATRSARVRLFDLRERLQAAGVPLECAPDYRRDIAALRDHSARELGSIDDAIACGSEGEIRVERVVVGEVLERARAGHVLVHGEPGAGKSWVMKQAALQHAGAHASTEPGECLFLRVENLPVRSTRQVEAELRIGHSFVEVLKAWRPGRNLLFLDGLDAAREANQARVIRDLVREITSETSWVVLASVRTFEMQHSVEWRHVFGSDTRDRAVEVPPLTQAELDTGLAAVPSVRDAVARGTYDLQELVRNPFNLFLLAQVVAALQESGEAPDRLAGIRTQIELLEEYWRHRVQHGQGGDARERCVLEAARLVLESGQLRVPRSLLLGTEAVNDLLHDGALVVADPPVGDYVRFFHNAFLDFACAKFLRHLRPEEVAAMLADTRKALFLRPPVRLLLAYTLRFAQSDFWALFRTFAGDARLAAMWSVLPPRVLADGRPTRQHLEPLLEWLEADTAGHATQALQFVLQSLSQRAQIDPVGDEGWLALACDLAPRLAVAFVNPYLAYLELLAGEAARLGEDGACRVNQCAQAVWEVAREKGWHFGRLTARAAGVIAQTMASAPEESKTILAAVADAHDHEECWYVARQIAAVVKADPSFAADLMTRIFSYRERSEEMVPVGGSWVLSLVQSRRQAWEMLWHMLEEAFPAFLDVAPVEATPVVTRVARDLAQGEQARRREFQEMTRHLQEDEGSPTEGVAQHARERVETFLAGGRQFGFERDGIYLWHDESPMMDSREKILAHFEDWLASAEGNAERQAHFGAVFELLYAANTLAVLWNRCLAAAARAPQALAAHVLPLVAASPVLRSLESRHYAADALASVFPLYDESQRAVIEQTILALPKPAGNDQEREWLERASDGFIGRLPADSLVLEQTRHRAAVLAASGKAPWIGPPVEMKVRFEPGEVGMDEVLGFEGVDTTTHAYHRLKELVGPVDAFAHAHLNAVPTIETCREVYPSLVALATAVKELRDSVHAKQHAWARRSLAEAAAIMARRGNLAPDDDKVFLWIANHLLAAADDPDPGFSVENETKAEQERAHLPVSSPAPRSEAAEGLVQLAGRGDLPEPLQSRLEDAVRRLAQDPVSGVRLRIALSLVALSRANADLMWGLARRFAARERVPAVLYVMCQGLLGRLVAVHPAAVAELACQVLDRLPDLSGNSILEQEIYALLAVAGVLYEEPGARARLNALLQRPIETDESISATVRAMSQAIIYDLDKDPEYAANVRRRAIAWYEQVAAHASSQLGPVFEQIERGEPVSESAAQATQAAAQVLERVAGILDAAGRPLGPKAASRRQEPDSVLRRLLDEAAGLVERLADVRHPAVHHRFLGFLASVLHLQPRRVVELVARSLGGGRAPDLRHSESLIAGTIAEIVEVLLADQRALLETDAEVQAWVVGIIDGFVRAGWPRAHQLLTALEEVAR